MGFWVEYHGSLLRIDKVVDYLGVVQTIKDQQEIRNMKFCLLEVEALIFCSQKNQPNRRNRNPNSANWGSSQSELLELQKEKLNAMDVKETPERLENSLKFVKKNISMLAAKLAIQSLELQ